MKLTNHLEIEKRLKRSGNGFGIEDPFFTPSSHLLLPFNHVSASLIVLLALMFPLPPFFLLPRQYYLHREMKRSRVM
jgi:hypothetical protein